MNRRQLSEEQFTEIVDLALDEDLGQGDVTSEVLIPPDLQGKASFLVKDKGILAGIEVARVVFLRVDPTLRFQVLIEDGTQVEPGDIVATISGRLIGILKAERTALNFLQRLSGVASETARLVAKTRGLGTIILDTRKTTPGLRSLEKYAVRMGGGQNHRLNLADWVLIKDNHIAALRGLGMSLKDIVAKAKRNAPQGMTIEVEITDVQQASEVVEAGADMILLDNMSPEEMSQAVRLVPDHIKTEASGGITLDNIEAIARTGVNFASSGALTHSVKILNISLEFEP